MTKETVEVKSDMSSKASDYLEDEEVQDYMRLLIP